MAFPARPPAPVPATGPIRIKSVSQFIGKILADDVSPRLTRTFRGHANALYTLKPSLYRKDGHSKREKDFLRELIRLHPDEFLNDRSAFDQMVRMQHFSMETRLLDVSFNPLVALYFSVIQEPDVDGEVIIFDVPTKSTRYFDSDTVSCLANLGNLSATERNAIRHMTSDKQLKRSQEGLRLLHFIKSEKPYFLPKIKLDDLLGIILAKPKQNNRRILAQQGAFFLFGLTDEIVSGYDEIEVKRILVPKGVKPKIIKDLDALNINGSSMFPEIESAAKYIIAKLTAVA